MEGGGGGNEGGERVRERIESGEVKETGMKEKIDKINVNDKEAASNDGESFDEHEREREKDTKKESRKKNR